MGSDYQPDGVSVTAYSLANTFQGLKEIPGEKNHPLIVWWLSLCGLDGHPDETPWCSAFVNGVCWLLRDWGIPRTNSARARSWLRVGIVVPIESATKGWDVVVLKRGQGPQPGPEVLDAPGHVGFYAGRDDAGRILVLGGNQSNTVNIQPFSIADLLGIRRLRC